MAEVGEGEAQEERLRGRAGGLERRGGDGGVEAAVVPAHVRRDAVQRGPYRRQKHVCEFIRLSCWAVIAEWKCVVSLRLIARGISPSRGDKGGRRVL